MFINAVTAGLEILSLYRACEVFDLLMLFLSKNTNKNVLLCDVL